jgi:hypothetical protein
VDESGFSLVDITLPKFSMLIYHLWDEKWPQFKDVVSPHRHDDHHQVKIKYYKIYCYIISPFFDI